MGHADGLVRRVQPLGVYTFREGSFSLGEWQALGAALDALDQWLQAGQRESLVMTATGEGLGNYEALFPCLGESSDVEARRAAIAGFLQIGGDGFTPEALNRCLQACGVACVVEEVGEVNHVRVSFPGTMGVPEGFDRMQIVIEDILPCQLGIEYWFRYCTWGETERYGLRWKDLNEMTWLTWMEYTE